MFSILNGKGAILRLHASWRDIIIAGGPTHEIVYRIEKLILRRDVVTNKIFIKTVKAHSILLACIWYTEQFQTDLQFYPQVAFWGLTHFEALVDLLVKKIHEFRIKAG